jgi:hypothetical protein
MAPSELTVVAGALDANAASPEQHYEVSEVRPHGGFPGMADPGDVEGLGQFDDIGVLMLSSPVAVLTPVVVMTLDRLDEALVPETPVILSGYGVTGPGAGAPSGVLFIAEAPYQRRTATEMLVGAPGTPDACPGDSGGPAYVWSEGALQLVGTTSRATLTATEACGEGGIYTLVPAYDGWLRDVAPGAYPPSAGPLPEGDDEPDDGCSVARVTPSAPWGWCLLLCFGALRRRRSSIRA